MVGKDFFKERLEGIYEFSLIKYYYGEGDIILGDKSIKVNWELCLDIKGDINLVLSSSNNLDFTDEDNNFFNYHMMGFTSDEKFITEFDDIIIYYSKYDSKSDSYIYYACCNSIGIKSASKYKNGNFTKAIVYLNNFNLKENELAIYKNNALKIDVTNRSFEIKLHTKSEDIRKYIDLNRLQYAVLASIDVEINKGEEIELILKEISSICWLLGLITLNTTFAPLVEVYNGDEVVYRGIKECDKGEYQGNYLIENTYENKWINKLFEKSYDNYKELQNEMEINKVIHFIQRIQVEKYIEVKYAILVLAYEYLLSKYLIFKGQSKDKVENLNIQQKIGEINKYLKFIPKELSGDDFRSDIRNPLFHQGSIPFMDLKTQVEYFNKYYDLLIQIVFKVLNYNGDYISRINYKVKKIK